MDINWTVIIAALITALIGSIPAAIVAWRTHSAVNSRMDKFIAMMEAKQAVAVDGAKAQATLDERAAEHVRKGEAAAVERKAVERK